MKKPGAPAFAAVAAGVATLALVLLLGPPLAPIAESDTEEYVGVAASLHSEWARDRPPAFPLLIRLCRSIAGERWPDFLIVSQAVMLAALAALLCRLLGRRGLPAGLAAAVAVASCSTPSLIYYSRCLLPEVLMAAFLALAWNATLRSIDGGCLSRSPVLAAGWAGFWSGAAALTKPVWLPGAVLLAAGILLARKQAAPVRRRSAVTLILVHSALVLCWQVFLFHQFGQLLNSRTGTIALNLAALRLGMTRFGAGTPLYRHLESVGLIDDALRLRFEDLTEFNRIKDAIPRPMRADVEFQKKVVFHHFGFFVVRQLRRLPAFFSTRPLDSGPVRSGGGLAGALRSLHHLAYAAFFRLRAGPIAVSPCLLLLLAGAVWSTRAAEYRDLYVVSLLCLGGFVLTTILLSFQDSTLARYRVEVEPMLMCVTLLPLCVGASRAARAVFGRRHDPAPR